jgi:hypothetical protein
MRLRSLLAPVAALTLLAGCAAGVYRPPAAAQLDLEPEMEINDEDVRKAFEARPQMLPSFNVAFYSFDASKAAPIEQLLRGLRKQPLCAEVPPVALEASRACPRPLDTELLPQRKRVLPRAVHA